MFRLLRALLKDLPRAAKSLERIAAALERAYPVPGEEMLEPLLIMTDAESIAAEEIRRQEWEKLHGPLRQGEIPPDDFQLEDEETRLRRFFGTGH